VTQLTAQPSYPFQSSCSLPFIYKDHATVDDVQV
jgi:hypothetical protein